MAKYPGIPPHIDPDAETGTVKVAAIALSFFELAQIYGD